MRHNRAEQVPRDAFHPREPKAFTEGMALEVVDKKNPSLIRPAVIIMTEDYHIKVLFIGWPEKYAYWLDDDSCNIFPPGYCKKTGHPIECPLGKIVELCPLQTIPKFIAIIELMASTSKGLSFQVVSKIWKNFENCSHLMRMITVLRVFRVFCLY